MTTPEIPIEDEQEDHLEIEISDTGVLVHGQPGLTCILCDLDGQCPDVRKSTQLTKCHVFCG